MTTRILPQVEWPKLAGTDISIALPFHRPEDVQIVVVEDSDQIVGAWAVLRVVQLEGVWIAPGYRKRVSVARQLMAKTFEVARRLAPCLAFTGSTSDDISALLVKHLGAKALPMEPFVIPLGELPCPSR